MKILLVFLVLFQGCSMIENLFIKEIVVTKVEYIYPKIPLIDTSTIQIEKFVIYPIYDSIGDFYKITSDDILNIQGYIKRKNLIIQDLYNQIRLQTKIIKEAYEN